MATHPPHTTVLPASRWETSFFKTGFSKLCQELVVVGSGSAFCELGVCVGWTWPGWGAETQKLILSAIRKEANPGAARTLFQFVILHFKANMMKIP